MQDSRAIEDRLATFSLFADLTAPQLQAVAHTFQESWFAENERVLRQGLAAGGMFVILEGSASVSIDGEERARLSEGDFFGELSILLGEAPVADVVASTALRCLVLPSPEVEPFLLRNPRVMYRMLQAQARRLRNANRWRA
jgi:CRP-like cAMP-binding protein